MRKVIAISMPEEMHDELRQAISRARYASLSEYIRELVRRDLESRRPADLSGTGAGSYTLSGGTAETAPLSNESVEVRGNTTIYEIDGFRFEVSSANDLVREFARDR